MIIGNQWANVVRLNQKQPDGSWKRGYVVTSGPIKS